MTNGGVDNSGRRRLILAFVVVVLIIAAALFLVRELFTSAQLQNCLLAGRTNCAPVELPRR